jgi:hypothetical protein
MADDAVDHGPVGALLHGEMSFDTHTSFGPMVYPMYGDILFSFLETSDLRVHRYEFTMKR